MGREASHRNPLRRLAPHFQKGLPWWPQTLGPFKRGQTAQDRLEACHLKTSPRAWWAYKTPTCSCRYGEDLLQFRCHFAMIKSICQNSEHKRFHLRYRLALCIAVRQCSWNLRCLRNPTAILFLLKLDLHATRIPHLGHIAIKIFTRNRRPSMVVVPSMVPCRIRSGFELHPIVRRHTTLCASLC